jgi:hypothetical protein
LVLFREGDAAGQSRIGMGVVSISIGGRLRMPNIWLHIGFLVLGAAIAGLLCRKDTIALGLGIGLGVSLSFTYGERQPWYLLAGLLFAALLLWRRKRITA